MAEPSPSVTPPPGNPRFPLMDAVRGIAILLVLFNHISGLSADWGTRIWGRSALYSDTGVLIFFVLSGFLLYRPYAAAHAGLAPFPHPVAFLRRRVLRIVPGYWLALTLLAIWPGVAGAFSGDWWRYYGFLQTYSQRTIELGVASAWSLCVEVSYYAMLPAFAAGVRTLVRPRPMRWVAVELAAIGGFGGVGLVGFVGVNRSLLPRWMLSSLVTTTEFFALGMALAVVSVALQGRENDQPAVRLIAAYPGLCWALAAVAFAAGVYPFDTRVHRASTLALVGNRVTLGLAALLIVAPAAFAGGGMVRRLLGSRVLAWIGVISYGIFLWHFALAAWLIDYRMPGDNGPGLTIFHQLPFFRMFAFYVTTLVLSAAVASVSYYLVEVPFLRLKERRLPAMSRPPRADAHP